MSDENQRLTWREVAEGFELAAQVAEHMPDPSLQELVALGRLKNLAWRARREQRLHEERENLGGFKVEPVSNHAMTGIVSHLPFVSLDDPVPSGNPVP